MQQVDTDEVLSDDESRNNKSMHVLAKLTRVEYIYQLAEDYYIYHFCDMKTRTNFSNVRMHAESLGSWSARVFFF
jgi:hypothetical protein